MILTKSTDHPYYASDSNFYADKAAQEYVTVSEFLDEWEDADVDMNYCYRFDISFRDESENHLCANFYLILQRKGIYKPIRCLLYDPVKESERLGEYLKKHHAVTLDLWREFT